MALFGNDNETVVVDPGGSRGGRHRQTGILAVLTPLRAHPWLCSRALERPMGTTMRTMEHWWRCCASSITQRTHGIILPVPPSKMGAPLSQRIRPTRWGRAFEGHWGSRQTQEHGWDVGGLAAGRVHATVAASDQRSPGGRPALLAGTAEVSSVRCHAGPAGETRVRAAGRCSSAVHAVSGALTRYGEGHGEAQGTDCRSAGARVLARWNTVLGTGAGLGPS